MKWQPEVIIAMYRSEIGDHLNGEQYWRLILYRQSTLEIFVMGFRDSTDTGHMVADGLEARTAGSKLFVLNNN